jgi:hypothetical protein
MIVLDACKAMSGSRGWGSNVSIDTLSIDGIDICSIALQVMLVSSQSCKQLGFWKPPFSLPRGKSG